MAVSDPPADEVPAVDQQEKQTPELATPAPSQDPGGSASPAVPNSEPAPETPEAPAETAAPSERHWYVIHTYSGYENKVQKNLEHRIATMSMQDHIFEVVVPTEEEVELRGGKRTTLQRKIYPGYVLVDMVLDDQSWYVVRNTPGVTGFVGSGNKPVPLEPHEVQSILKRMEEETPKFKVSFTPGQAVKIVDGPFAEFTGTVDEIFPVKGKVKVLVSFFGRETPIELDFLQVERT